MIAILFFIVGLSLGGMIMWDVLSSRNSAKAAESETKIKAIEELRQQLQQKDAELEKLCCTLSSEQQTRAGAQARLEEANKNIEEQRKIFVKYEEKLKDTFNTLSYNALRDNQQAFLSLAKNTLEGLLSEAKADMGKNKQEIESAIKPLKESLTKYEQLTKELEKTRSEAYSGLKQDLDQVSKDSQIFKKEAENLGKALKKIENAVKAKQKDDVTTIEKIQDIDPIVIVNEEKPLEKIENPIEEKRESQELV